MELSRDGEDKDERITIPYEANKQPIKKLEEFKRKYKS